VLGLRLRVLCFGFRVKFKVFNLIFQVLSLGFKGFWCYSFKFQVLSLWVSSFSFKVLVVLKTVELTYNNFMQVLELEWNGALVD